MTPARRRTRRRTKAVSARDFCRLQSAILALHSHRTLAAFRQATPAIFLDLVPAGYFALGDFRLDTAHGRVRILNTWESHPTLVGAMREIAERILPEHPFTRHAMRGGGPVAALRLSDFFTLPQLRRTRLYREVLQPNDAGRLLSVYSLSGPGMATLSLARPESSPDFSERDRRLLEMLQPHFDLARANIEREAASRANRAQSLRACGLTPREIEVALWLAQGKSNPELAAILATPVRTIEKHVEHILAKLGTENRSSAALAIGAIIRA